MNRIRIVSDGTGAGTQVLVDGKAMPNVFMIEWFVTARGEAHARLRVAPVDIEVEAADAKIEKVNTAACSLVELETTPIVGDDANPSLSRSGKEEDGTT